MRINPEQGEQFATMLAQDEEPLADLNQVCLLIRSCTIFRKWWLYLEIVACLFQYDQLVLFGKIAYTFCPGKRAYNYMKYIL